MGQIREMYFVTNRMSTFCCLELNHQGCFYFLFFCFNFLIFIFGEYYFAVSTKYSVILLHCKRWTAELLSIPETALTATVSIPDLKLTVPTT